MISELTPPPLQMLPRLRKHMLTFVLYMYHYVQNGFPLAFYPLLKSAFSDRLARLSSIDYQFCIDSQVLNQLPGFLHQ